MPEKQQRNSAIELLRIVAMLFIVCSHMCAHNGMTVHLLPLTLNKILIQSGSLGNLGVDIFVIISGYFLCEKAFSTKRVSSLFVQVWFYSILVAAISIFAFDAEASMFNIIKAVFPTVFAEYWFFTAYIILLLVSPFINCMIDHLSRTAYCRLLVCLVALWVVIPTVTTKDMYGSEIPQFVLLYLIGAYFKKYPNNVFKSKAVRVVLTAVSFVLLFLSVIVINLVTENIDSLASYRMYATFFFSRSSMLIVGCAIGMFSIAAYSTPFHSNVINAVSSTVFGVYLIHEQPLFRHILWTRIFDIEALYSSPLFPIHGIFVIVIVFACASAIELVRLKTIATPMSAALDKLLQCIVRLCSKLTKAPKD